MKDRFPCTTREFAEFRLAQSFLRGAQPVLEIDRSVPSDLIVPAAWCSRRAKELHGKDPLQVEGDGGQGDVERSVERVLAVAHACAQIVRPPRPEVRPVDVALERVAQIIVLAAVEVVGEIAAGAQVHAGAEAIGKACAWIHKMVPADEEIVLLAEIREIGIAVKQRAPAQIEVPAESIACTITRDATQRPTSAAVVGAGDLLIDVIADRNVIAPVQEEISEPIGIASPSVGP